jgi:uncharacterized protein YbjQ (UPF0145 family)
MTAEEEQRLLKGGLPDLAERRLQELVAAGMTSSFLDVRGFAMGAAEGIDAVGQVVGASSCRLAVGVVRRTRGPAGRVPLGQPVWREHDGPIQSWTTARRRAMQRLVDQAKLLEADAVLRIEPRFAVRDVEPRVVEVVMTGTAVRTGERKPAEAVVPVLGTVSVQEYCLLRRVGVELAGIVGSCSSVEVAAGAATRSALAGRWTGVGNVELSDLSKGVYEARRLAVQRLAAEARSLGASGVIGVDLARWLADPDSTHSHNGITVHLLGTAMRGHPTARVDVTPLLRL